MGVLDCCFIGAWLLEFLKLKGLTHFQKIGPFLSDTSENYILFKFEGDGVFVGLGILRTWIDNHTKIINQI